MQAAYLEKLNNVEASDGEQYTFEEHLKQDSRELQRKVDSLQQILDDTKASTGEEINRLKVGVDALAITNRYTRNSLNQKIVVLKAENEALAVTNRDMKTSMGEEIDIMQGEVASLTTANHNVKLSVEENNRLKMELNVLSDRAHEEISYLGKCNQGLKKEVEGLNSSVNDITYINRALKEEVEELKSCVTDLTYTNVALKGLRESYGDLKTNATFLDNEERTTCREHPKVKELISQREMELLNKHKALIELGAKL
ncbi:hypothetical protein EYC80_002696 [Monilinia laxa]|uniref:Uncharacterized protein n=1 Tax=Monilinia laxa TaxID=61186 RepID=A0A5N6K4S4_MONLA|nr:hypothetical protein EYC80_002696 [Monilinia laxa]